MRKTDLDQAGVERLPRVVGVRGGLPELADGRKLEPAAVLWCTGYELDYLWIHLPGFDQLHPAHDRGVAAGQPGLYFVGLPFQSTLASSLVGGVGRDARYVAERI